MHGQWHRSRVILGSNICYFLTQHLQHVFQQKGDNAPMPPITRRPLLLTVEHTVNTHLLLLHADPQTQAALCAYHCGEGLKFSAPRSSVEGDVTTRVVQQLDFV